MDDFLEGILFSLGVAVLICLTTQGFDYTVPNDIFEVAENACIQFEGVQKVKLDWEDIMVTCNKNNQEIYISRGE